MNAHSKTNLPAVAKPSALLDPARFEHLQRVGKMLALSPLFPDHLGVGKNPLEKAVANGVLVMNIADRLNEDPLTVAQNIYFVSGKPGWAASYMIAKANQFGVFKSPIEWEVKGSGADLVVTAYAETSATGRRVSATVSMAMAKAENWTKNTKYQTMPEVMLRYRSATFLIRQYCPEVMVGMPSTVEIESGDDREMVDVTPKDVYDHTPAAEEKPKADPAPKQEAAPKDEPKAEAKAETKPEPEAKKEEAAPDETDDERQKAIDDHDPEAALRDKIIEELDTAIDAGEVDGVLELYGDMLTGLEKSSAGIYDEIMQAAKDRKADLDDE